MVVSKAYLSTNGAAFPAGEGSNFNPIRCELLEEEEGVIDCFAVEDVIPEEKRGRRLEITTVKVIPRGRGHSKSTFLQRELSARLKRPTSVASKPSHSRVDIASKTTRR